MTTINLDISVDALKTQMETLLWKYGNGIENEENKKAVHNVKSDRVANAADSLIVGDTFGKRLREAIHIMREFFVSVTDMAIGKDSVKRITISMPNRWKGNEETLQSLVERYIQDGMMADWLNVTAPSEAAIYTAKLPQDETNINVELYSKGAP